MMIGKMLKAGSALLCCAGVLANSGCCGDAKGSCVKTAKVTYKETYQSPCGDSKETLAALPPNAKPGECWAKVYVPPTYKTVTEQIVVRPASEQLEIVPAEYEWVEERVLVKDASKELAISPAQFDERERTIQTYPGSRDWQVTKADNCDFPKNQPARDVFCLVDRPPEHKTIREQHVVKPATVEEKCVAAEYTTVRRQKLVHAATTRKIPIPAEFATIEKQVKVCDARMAWQRVVCEEPGRALTAVTPRDTGPVSEVNESPDRINKVKSALMAQGYSPGPLNGEIRARDWVAINKYQRDHNLPVGDLNSETMKELGV